MTLAECSPCSRASARRIASAGWWCGKQHFSHAMGAHRCDGRPEYAHSPRTRSLNRRQAELTAEAHRARSSCTDGGAATSTRRRAKAEHDSATSTTTAAASRTIFMRHTSQFFGYGRVTTHRARPPWTFPFGVAIGVATRRRACDRPGEPDQHRDRRADSSRLSHSRC